LFGAVSVVAGVGLLRLHPYARLLAIAYIIFGLLNSIVSYALPGSTERFAKIMDAMPSAFHAPSPPSFNPLLISAIMMPFGLVPIYFLWRNKRAFDQSAPTLEMPTFNSSAQ